MAPMASPSFGEMTDFENASRGLIDSLEPCIIKNSSGRVVWNNEDYKFLDEAECPRTANPKLWRQGQLLAKQGLFIVVDGIYQVRGFDAANMTLVETDSGVIVVDPLTSMECAAAALKFYREHRGVVRLGVLPADTKIPVIAPEGFLEHAISENVYAGGAMSRRATYMYGDRLDERPAGQIGCGLSMAISSGTVTLIPPTVVINRTGQEEVIDGVKIVFQVTPGTEAPCEMNFHFPQRRALCMAENATHLLHNILTLRGPVVRDASAWSRYLDEAIVLFTQESDVVFASHTWPTWGHDAIVEFLSEQRDLYGYMHDQTLRMINQCLTGIEIAEEIVLPVALQKAWHTQGRVWFTES